MYLGTLESNFVRSIAILVGLSVILFAAQGIMLPIASYYGQIMFWGMDLLQVMQFIGLLGGVASLVSIKVRSREMQRWSFAFISWFYMVFIFVLVWLIGLQSPSIVLSLTMVFTSAAIYGYLTQKGKDDADSNGSTYRKGSVRKNISSSNQSTRHDEGSIQRD